MDGYRTVTASSGLAFSEARQRSCLRIVRFVVVLPQQVTMSLSAARVAAARTVSRKAPVQLQKRGIVNYLTNYPDKVSVLVGAMVVRIETVA
jgi:hypothetical protein